MFFHLSSFEGIFRSFLCISIFATSVIIFEYWLFYLLIKVYKKYCEFIFLDRIFTILLILYTGDLTSKIENPWSKYLLSSKFEINFDAENYDRYKGMYELILSCHSSLGLLLILLYYLFVEDIVFMFVFTPFFILLISMWVKLFSSSFRINFSAVINEKNLIICFCRSCYESWVWKFQDPVWISRDSSLRQSTFCSFKKTNKKQSDRKQNYNYCYDCFD